MRSISSCISRSCPGPLYVTAHATPDVIALAGGVSNPFTESLPPIVPLLSAVRLSEAQEDQIFAILHRGSPSVRENAKQLRKAYESVAKLAASADYNKNKTELDMLARGLGDAAAQSALLQAQLEHEIGQVLTPKQRHVIEKARRDGPVELDHGNCAQRLSPTGPDAR
jgi:hypothetical protein